MDIRVSAAEPTPAERDAVDAVLGPPVSGWAGGERDMEREAHTALLGGHDARGRRDMLLPALQAVQARVGWIGEGAMNYVCRRLVVPPAEAYGVATFYHLLSTVPRAPTVVHVCDDIACRVRGAEELCAAFQRILGGPGAVSGAVGWKRSPCLGQCERAPAAMVVAAGEAPRTFTVAPADAETIAPLLRAPPATADTRSAAGASARARLDAVRRSVPQAGSKGLRLLKRVGVADPLSLDGFLASGGYAGLKRALAIGPEATVREVVLSKLLGRGGAAFPVGRKWDAVAKAPGTPRYLVCNADESEPGTFKDRILMEEDPFAVLEGMTIGAFAAGCARGFVYLRGEYPLAAERMASAIDAARARGFLGPSVLGTKFGFDIEIRRGGGAYICGEETALFNSIEGKRGEPRSKPPYPVHVGLFGKPTLVNNVETLANVPLILEQGGEAFAATGTAGSSGTKLFCVSGHVERPGLFEVAFGTTLRAVLDLAGGTRRPLRAVLLGGAAGAFAGPSQLDVPLTFEDTRAAGLAVGSGVVMAFDETTDMLDILRRIAEFFRDESCGQCVPCRVGTVRQEELLARLRAGRPLGSREQELVLLREIGQAMRDASICGLGHTASIAVESVLLGPLGKELR